MKRRIVALTLIGVCLIIMSPVGALAATTAVVTVVMQADVSGGISGFTITYVTDTHMHLNWTLTGEAVNIMVRAKYGAYPDKIPNSTTAPSDGYLVYYGSGSEADDTSMNFDENAGALYYSAWAQKADGSWFMDMSTGWQESAVMTFITLIGLAVVVSVIALKFPNYLFAVIGGGIWAVPIAYVNGDNVSQLPAGTTTEQMLIVLFAGMALAVFIVTIMFTVKNSRASSAELKYYSNKTKKGQEVIPTNYDAYMEAREKNNNAIRGETESEYRARVRNARRKFSPR